MLEKKQFHIENPEKNYNTVTINVVLSTAARQQQHGQHQLMSTLPPGPVTTTPGQTSKRSEDILLLADQVLASYHLFILIVI